MVLGKSQLCLKTMYWTIARLILASVALAMVQAHDSTVADCGRPFACASTTCCVEEDCLNSKEKNEIFFITVKSQKLDQECLARIETILYEAVKRSIVIMDDEALAPTAEPEQSTMLVKLTTGITEKPRTSSDVSSASHVATQLSTATAQTTSPRDSTRYSTPQITKSHSATERETTTEVTRTEPSSSSPYTTSAVTGTAQTQTNNETRTSDVSMTSASPSTSSSSHGTDSSGTTSMPTEVSSTKTSISTLGTTTVDVKNETTSYQLYFLMREASEESSADHVGTNLFISRAVVLKDHRFVLPKQRLPFMALSQEVSTILELDPLLNGTTVEFLTTLDDGSPTSSKKTKYWIAAVSIVIVLAVAAVGLKIMDKYDLQSEPTAQAVAASQTEPVEMISIPG